VSTLNVSPSFQLNYVDPNPGGSPGVLLLHGLGAAGSSWMLQFPDLIEHGYRPLAPDLRGFGGSTWQGKISVSLLAEDCIVFLNRLGLERIHLAGISMGGVIAQQIALNYPERVEKLVLANTFHRLRPKSPLHWFYYAYRFMVLQVRGLKPQAKMVAHRLFPLPEQEEYRKVMVEQVSQSNTGTYRSAMLMLARFNSTRRLREIRCPVLVITGESDTTVDPRLQAKMTSLIPNARQVVVSGAGHAVSVDHAPEFNRLLLDFLAEGMSIGSDSQDHAK
jgi:pimeloyl-ACP methyl ester carboxylesterase